MTQQERDRFLEDVLDVLPDQASAMSMCESRLHKKTKTRALDMLRLHFRALSRRVYLADEMAVVYPGQEPFSPDLFAVLDVEEPEDDPRTAWVVADERRGPDWVLEVVHAGDRKKDLADNVERYAALGIPEYFVCDLRQQRIHAFRLADTGRYQPVLAQAGLYRSNVLGLDLAIVEGSLRFCLGAAELYDTAQLIRRLQGMVDSLEARSVELETQTERALAMLRRAIVALLAARGIGCCDEGRARLDACDDSEMLNQWLSRATTAGSEAEVFSERVRP